MSEPLRNIEILIFNPTKSAMQSGTKKMHEWFVKFVNYSQKDSDYIFDLMNWKGSGDTLHTIEIPFKTREDAIRFAVDRKFKYSIEENGFKKVKPKSYTSNFTT